MYYFSNNNIFKRGTIAVVLVIAFSYLCGMFNTNNEMRQECKERNAIYQKLAFVQSDTKVQKLITNQQIEEEAELITVSVLDSRLPTEVYLRIDEASPMNPLILSDERITDEDIAIDISNAIDSNLEYTVSNEEEIIIRRVVHREAGSQSILGQLKVAEEVVSRLRSGIYGPDFGATLEFGGYGVEEDDDGSLHVYDSEGIEIVDVPEIATTVTTLALKGSNTTILVLKAATALRNEQFGLDFGDKYYNLGAFYHYNPDKTGEVELGKRVINRVPVSYRYEEHVFYGKWLEEKDKLNMS